MSEIDMNRINAEIEEQIKMCASNIELANDETALRVTIPDAVALDQNFSMNWWLEFIGQSVFQWHGRTFYCCDVEPTEDSHVWICHSLDLHSDFPLQIGREIETFKHERLEPQNASEIQMLEWPWVRGDSV
jgi:hypothetical protein